MSTTVVEFNNRVLMVGFGSVAQCTLPILVKHLRVPLENITVLDFEDQASLLEPWTSQGVRFVRQRITPDNLGAVLGEYLAAGDLLIDLAWNIDCCEILTGATTTACCTSTRRSRCGTRTTAICTAHPDAADALLAAHEPAPDAGRMVRAGADGGAGARGQPRPDLALHQAGPAGHRRSGCWPRRR